MAASGQATKSDFEAIRVNLQKSLLESTKLAAQLPTASDLRYQRTLSRPLGKKVDQASQRLLHITSRVLDLAKQAESSAGKGKKPARDREATELQEEDVVDTYQGKIVKATDYLLEQIDKNLDAAFKASKLRNEALHEQSAAPVASTSRAVAGDRDASRNFKNAGDIRKPQLDFGQGEYSTSSNEVFKPLLPSKPHSITPLDFTPVSYYDPITKAERSRVPNPYAQEIQAALAKPFPELENPYASENVERMSSHMADKPYLYVDTPEKLTECLAVLNEAKVIAIDLEHHDLRSYRGITCLIQISTITHDYIVDPLVPAVRSSLHTLNEAFANPDIIKVLHGAEWDIIWLQRDFGLYIVNLFDTYHASRAINRLSGHSLASLLREYTTFVPEKKYQLADWRIRPLTEELVKYARSDTHFLIYIFFAILGNPAMTPAILQDIRQRSADTASQVYEHAEYDFEEGYGSGGWRRLADRSGKLQMWGVDDSAPVAQTDTSEPWKWTDKQGRAKFEVFRSLHAWRDQVAREEDESTGYILSNRNLMAIAEKLPEKMADLVFCLGSDMDGPLRGRSGAILEQVAQGKRKADEILKKQEEEKAAGGEEIQPPASTGLWKETMPDSAAPTSRTSAFAKAFSTVSQGSGFSSLFPRPRSQQLADKPVSEAFETAVKKVHQALLEQFQSTSSGILSKAAGAEAGEVVQGREELSAPPVSAEQMAQSDDDDGIVQVNSRKKGKGKKRKSPDTEKIPETSASTTAGSVKLASKQTKMPAYVKPFDYTGVKSVLDEPMEQHNPRKRPKKVKGGDQQGAAATSEGPTFKRAPKSMNQPKSGNKSHTFV